jgi:proteasome lid subunit RPN8/RPN11
MGKSKVKVYHTKPTAWCSDVDNNIKDLFKKYGDILIDWKIAANKNGEFIIWYVLKDDDDTPDEKQIKI